MSEVDKSPLHYKLGREQLRGKRLSIRILVFFVLELSHFFFLNPSGNIYKCYSRDYNQI